MVHLELSQFIIFLWQLASACWARRLYLSPSLRETQIIVWLCVNSVWKSTICKSYFYGERTPSGEASLHLRRQLTNYTSNYWYVLCKSMSSWLQVTKTSHCAAGPVCLRCAEESYFLANLTTCCWLLAAGGTRIVTWLILPVVICLSQRLSHACLSINAIQWNCEWLIKTVIVYMVIEFTWITVVILELIHAVVPDLRKAVFIR